MVFKPTFDESSRSDYSQVIELLIPIVIADECQDLVQCRVRDKFSAEPIVDESQWHPFQALRTAGLIVYCSRTEGVNSGRVDCLMASATWCAKLWVARKLPPKKRTLPLSTRSQTICPSRVKS